MVTPIERSGMPEAVALIRESRRIVLASHVNPDGDALGSMLALALALESLGKDVVSLSADGVPELLDFLPALDRIEKATERRDFDLAIVLDAGNLSRIGTAQPAIASAPRLMDIDHHVTGGEFGDVRLLDAGAAATAEIVYDLLIALGCEITLPIAECLLCGLLTDTGSFRFMNVTPRTMEIGAAMIRCGASPNVIAENVFENKSYEAQRLLGRALESLRRSPDGRVVWGHVTQADFKEFAAGDEATEGVVNAIRSVRGADVALFFRELSDGRLRVSLRSRETVDVSAIAQKFGGGGHRLASGCTLEGPLADAEALLVAEVCRSLSA